MKPVKMAGLKPKHFLWRVEGTVAVIQLDRPERKNPLTFESYAELRDTFRDLVYADDVEAMLNCSKPIVTAVDGVAVGAGAIVAMASDIRIATPEAKTAFLFTRVGLAGCDMGACAMLPRIIGQGRAAELLYTSRSMSAEEGERWGFYNRLVAADALEADALDIAARIVSGPTFAHGITKTHLNQEWSMGLDQAIEAEAQAQAICMQTKDFERAYRAFVDKKKPVFEGN